MGMSGAGAGIDAPHWQQGLIVASVGLTASGRLCATTTAAPIANRVVDEAMADSVGRLILWLYLAAQWNPAGPQVGP